MKAKIKTILGILLFAALLAAAYFAYNALSETYKPDNQLQEGETEEDGEVIPAPDFNMVDTEGNDIKLSDFFGKPIVLNFWASWCGPCKDEMPHFDKVYSDVKDDITFLMVNMTDGQRETVEKGKDYISESGYSFPVYFDTEQDGAYTYGISSIPTTVFIDKAGNIITGIKGSIDEETLLLGISLISGD